MVPNGCCAGALKHTLHLHRLPPATACCRDAPVVQCLCDPVALVIPSARIAPITGKRSRTVYRGWVKIKNGVQKKPVSTTADTGKGAGGKPATGRLCQAGLGDETSVRRLA